MRPRAEVCALFALAIIQCSCSTMPSAKPGLPTPPALPEQSKTTTNSARPIGLLVGDAPARLDSGQRVGSAVDSQVAVGTLKGAGAGALSCFQVGGGFGGGGQAGAMAALVWLVLCEPVAIVVGGTVGGVSAYNKRTDPAADLSKDVRTAIARSATTARDDVLKALEQSATANRISTVRLGSKSAPVSGGVVPAQVSPAMALEVTIVRFFIVRSESALQGDGVGVEAHVRVLALPERKVLDSYTFLRRPNDANVSKAVSRTVASALADAYRDIAEAALEESILVYRGEKNGAGGDHTDAPSAFPDYTLRPIYPPVETLTDDGRADGGARPPMADLQPTFRWEALPASFAQQARGENGIRDVIYELRLYRGVAQPPYVRSGLTAPTYSLETPLAPCESYGWTVRAHFTLDGQPRVTEWAGMYNGGALSSDSFGASKPPLPAIDPAWYRRNSVPPALEQTSATAYYPHFRTAAAAPHEICPADSTGRPGATSQTASNAAQATLPAASMAPIPDATSAVTAPSTASQTAVAPPTTTRSASAGTDPTLPQVGDSWTYNVLNGGRVVDTLTVSVSASSELQVGETLLSGKSSDFKSDRVFQARFDPKNGFEERELPGRFFIAEMSPYVPPTRSDIGMEWNGIASKLTTTLAGKVREDWRLNVKVIGIEHIRVPAGEFDALKVEAVSDIHRWADSGDGYVRMRFWYAPGIKRTVKMERRFEASKTILSYTDVYELSRYTEH